MANIENGYSRNSRAESQKKVAYMTANVVPASPVMQRLVLIRKLHHEAENLADQGGLVGALSVLLFHDSVDLFAQLTREVLLPASTVGRNNPSMLENLGELNGILPNTPINMQKMRNLGTARDALKHGGIIPAEREIERFRIYVADLFDDITPLAFQTAFSDVSMASLITLKSGRDFLLEALRQADSGNIRGSLSETGKALYLLIHEHKKTLYALAPTTRIRTYAVEDEGARCCVGRSNDGTSYGTALRPYTLNCVSPIVCRTYAVAGRMYQGWAR